MAGESLFREEKVYNCPKCKDKTFIIENAKVYKCPECSVGTKGIILDEDKILLAQEGVIPENYRDLTFDKTRIKNDSRIPIEIKQDPNFDYYLDTIERLYDLINSGEKLKYSLLITAPQGFGKNSLVYSCLNAAIRNGKTVAPYLDSLELNNIIIGSDERYNYEDQEIMNKLTNADVCFIKIPQTTYVSAIRSLKIIVDRRARKGLATIATSRNHVGKLLNMDSDLTNFFITNNFGDSPVDYYRLRVITSPYGNLDNTRNKYNKKSNSSNWG